MCIIGVDKMRKRIRELADPDLKDCVPTSINSPLKDYRCLYLYEHLMPTCLSSLVLNFAISLGSSFHAMASSVVLYSTHARQNETYFFK